MDKCYFNGSNLFANIAISKIKWDIAMTTLETLFLLKELTFILLMFIQTWTQLCSVP